jgi:hypothetical protein
MRKLALMFGALGFIAFSGLGNADEKTVKTEDTVKTESGTTIGGKHKVVKTRKTVAADGTTTDSKTEVVTPKSEKRDVDNNAVKPVRDDKNVNSEVSEKTEEHTTLTGKKQIKSTKKVEKPDGTQVESTTTTTMPKPESNKK